MNRFIKTVAVVVLFSTLGWAQKAVLVDENEPIETSSSESPSRTRVETKRGSFLQSTGISKERVPTNSIEIRSRYRVGLGLAAAGKYGLVGIQSDFNFLPSSSVYLGIGAGNRFTSLSTGWKKFLTDGVFSTYGALGLSHWSSSGGGRITESSPSYLSGQLLTPAERISGKFSKIFLVPSLGIQYNSQMPDQLRMSLFAEIMSLIYLGKYDSIITGSFGVLYYF